MRTILLCVAMLFSAHACPQGVNTGFGGTVVDPSGSAVSGADITVIRIETGDEQTIRSDSEGKWEFRYLGVGAYTIRVEAPGFARLTREGLTASTGVIANVPLELPIGQLSESVVVTADAEMVDRASATIALELDSREIENLPTSSRNFTQLLLIEPGVAADLSEPLTNKNANISPTVNGARTTSNSITYNGVDATSLLCCNERINKDRGTLAEGGGTLSRNIAPALETLSEVKLKTSLYDASSGRNGGGSFTVVTKSGTNDFHGTVYHYLQNDKLIANDFFFNRAGLERQRLQRNEGGVTFGGPILRNRSFFFGSYQFTRANSAFVDEASSTVRMPETLTSDRSDAAIDAFAASLDVDDPSLINPISRQLLQAQFADGSYLIPSGNTGNNCQDDEEGRSCQVVTVIPSQFKQDQGGFSFDQKIGDPTRLSIKGFLAEQPSRDPLTSSNAGSLLEIKEESKHRVLSAVVTHVFGPRVVGEFSAGVFRNINHTVPTPYFTNAQFGIDNPLAGERPDLAQFTIEPEDVGGEVVFGTPTFTTTDVQNTFSYSGVLSYSSGRHFLKFGGEARRHQLNGDYQEVKNVQYGFESWFNFLTVGALDDGDPGEQIAEVSLNYGETSRAFRMNDVSFFVADDWKVTRTLTLNLGLRYDYFGWPWEKNGLIANFDPERALASGNMAEGYVFASNYKRGTLGGDSAIPLASNRSTLPADRINPAPRFGFSWSPDFGRGLAIRGGYGIYYDRPTGGFVNSLRTSPPFFREQEINDVGDFNDIPLDPPTFPLPQFRVSFDDGEPFLSTEADPDAEFEALETQILDKNLRIPYIQQWNLMLQIPIANDLSLDFGYAGTKGTKLLQAVNLNPPADIDTLGSLARAGVPGGAFIGNYFTNEDDEFVNTAQPECDLFDDPDDCVIAAELRAPILGFDEDEGLNALVSNANSIYHSFQASLRKRFGNGLSFSGNYTWSKSIDTFSDEGLYQADHDQRRLHLNRAVSDFDRPHRFTLNYTWDLPFPGNNFLRGWSLSGIGTFQSGRPFSIIDDDFSGILYASTSPRPSLVPGATSEDLATSGNASSRVGNYIDAGVLESTGSQFGSLGRNVMRAPAQRRFDLSLRKIFAVTERSSLEFRSEMYNITNTANFRKPDSDLSSGDFGQIDRTQGGPRVVQFAVKLMF